MPEHSCHVWVCAVSEDLSTIMANLFNKLSNNWFLVMINKFVYVMTSCVCSVQRSLYCAHHSVVDDWVFDVYDFWPLCYGSLSHMNYTCCAMFWCNISVFCCAWCSTMFYSTIDDTTEWTINREMGVCAIPRSRSLPNADVGDNVLQIDIMNCVFLLLCLRVMVMFLGIQVLFVSDVGPSFFRRGACEGLTLKREETVSRKSYALSKMNWHWVWGVYFVIWYFI